jgi:VWFA-related protein
VRKLAVLALLGFSLPAFASKTISVAELEQKLSSSRGRPDVEVAQQLSDFELTERLSTATLARLELNSPGTKTSQELKILADQSAFLLPPPAEIPNIPAPDLVTQRKLMSLVVSYVSKTIHQLPNFYATRATTHFEETPQIQTGTSAIRYQPLHQTDAFEVTVLYQNGQEVVDNGKHKTQGSKQQGKGLRDWGVFGPILSTVFLDAAKGDLRWSHWEQTSTGTQAVFSYSVPLEKSHYRVNYCCIPGSDPDDPTQWAPLDRIVGYRGEITVDVHEGSILRLTVQADLKTSDPISRADIMVEYGPVEIGGQSYICATRSVALSSALSTSNFVIGDHEHIGSVAPSPLQELLNEVEFKQYHLFRSSSRIVTEDDAKEQSEPQAAPSASAIPSEQVTALPASRATEGADDGSSASRSESPAASVEEHHAEPAAAVAPPKEAEATPTEQAGASLIDQVPVFKATTHEVVVDVVATKTDGDPVLGLGKQDFEIRENGKPQVIDFFEAHTKGDLAAEKQPVMPEMPAGARTNVPPAPPGDAVNMLLIDTLNTDMQDQEYVHREVLAFFAKMQPGTRMAIFVLGSKLTCLQGFTSDTSTLLAALKDQRSGLKNEKSSLLHTRSDRAGDEDALAMLLTMRASGVAVQGFKEALANAGGSDAGARASMTFEALMYLGHYLSGVPGRKNLIWFAGSFPLVIFPTADQLAHRKQHPGVPGYVERVKMTADLFTVSQIAVYPISAEGLMTEHIGEADSAGPGVAGGVGHLGSAPDVGLSPYNAAANERANTIRAMEQLAASTGGKAYYNSNDLNAALRHAVDDGANYYTIGYSPADRKMDGSYRQIEIKLVHGKSKLAYRQGYNADAGSVIAAQSDVDPLKPLLQLGLPGATGILYGVHAGLATVQPSPGEARAGQNQNLKGTVARYTVNFFIRGQDLIPDQERQGERRAKFLLGLKAYDDTGNALNWQANEETVDIEPEQLGLIRKNGIPVHLDIDVPTAGAIHLVTAVYDQDSGMAGTLEIPLQLLPK